MNTKYGGVTMKF